MSNPLPSLLALTSIADGSAQQAAPIRNNYAAIQTAVNELIAALNAGVAGQVLQSAGASALQWGSKTTVSALSGGPPGSPTDQDIWIATNVDANGTRWQFQYNAASASTYKWEFIGGSPLYLSGGNGAIVNTYTQVGATGYYYNPASMGWAAVRAGDYSISGDIQILANGGVTGNFNIATFAGSSITTSAGGAMPAGQNPSEALFGRVTTVAAGTEVGVALLPVQASTNILGIAHTYIIPLRVA